MTSTDLFSDDRLQFFLQNRDDIKAWAAIESDVIAATRELLARSQPAIQETLSARDAATVLARHDSGPWERILARHPSWPVSVGLALEWHRNVDPTGLSAPKLGVFWAPQPHLLDAQSRFLTEVDKSALAGLGYKVPLEGFWPVGGRAVGAGDWWRDPDGFVLTIVDRLDSTWPIVAPLMDELLAVEPQVTDA